MENGDLEWGHWTIYLNSLLLQYNEVVIIIVTANIELSILTWISNKLYNSIENGFHRLKFSSRFVSTAISIVVSMKLRFGRLVVHKMLYHRPFWCIRIRVNGMDRDVDWVISIWQLDKIKTTVENWQAKQKARERRSHLIKCM